jgi:t-SNARE complex subunit (syntaxin)
MKLKKLTPDIRKYYDEIKEENFDQTQWNKKGAKISLDIQSFESLFNKLTKNIDHIKNNALERNFEDTLEQIEPELERSRELMEKINAIKEKTRHFSSTFERNSTQENNFPQVEGQVLDIMNEKDILEKRRKELETIHQTSAMLKDTTDKMAQDVHQQGAILNQVEIKTEEAENNAKKGHQEIQKADEISRGNRKRLFCLLAIVFIAVGELVAIIVSLIT